MTLRRGGPAHAPAAAPSFDEWTDTGGDYRLVVDTGLHAKHWTLQQGIDDGIPPYEVERYVVYPGQACSYMIGQLKIVELREKLKAKLGDKFSIKAFHTAVQLGSVPLSALEAEMARVSVSSVSACGSSS